MSLGLVGRKRGMTRIFDDRGASIAVTVVAVPANRVVQRKTVERDGYNAVQIGCGERRADRLSRAVAGHYAKHEAPCAESLHEFRLPDNAPDAGDVADTATVSLFSIGDVVDVTGQSKGKGFQGGIKRWHFSSQDASHGNSLSHRSNGSIGQCQTPGRVWKGKKMSGHMGARRTTTLGLRIAGVDERRALLLIEGAVPGASGGRVIVRPSSRSRATARDGQS